MRAAAKATSREYRSTASRRCCSSPGEASAGTCASTVSTTVRSSSSACCRETERVSSRGAVAKTSGLTWGPAPPAAAYQSRNAAMAACATSPTQERSCGSIARNHASRSSMDCSAAVASGPDPPARPARAPSATGNGPRLCPPPTRSVTGRPSAGRGAPVLVGVPWRHLARCSGARARGQHRGRQRRGATLRSKRSGSHPAGRAVHGEASGRVGLAVGGHMGVLDRIRRRLAGEQPPAQERPAVAAPVAPTPAEEARLWAVLREDPNDVQSFHALAEIVRRWGEEGHEGGDPRKAADDAVWSLAEELAHSPRAWYPLIELGRLSVHDDREQALKRLATASDRDPSGIALATAVAMLREEGRPADALGLGVGHWRPREHDVEVGRQLVLAAIEAGRAGEARRTLEALST